LSPAGGTVFCVDHWLGSPNDTTSVFSEAAGADGVYKLFCKNVGDKLDRTIKTIREFSQDAAAQLAPQEADIVFLDAGHNYDELQADLKAWLPHVAANGFICGHDYSDSFPGVIQAVQETFAGCQIVRPQGTVLWIVRMADYHARTNTPSLSAT
jgi:hypothetical protein